MELVSINSNWLYTCYDRGELLPYHSWCSKPGWMKIVFYDSNESSIDTFFVPWFRIPFSGARMWLRCFYFCSFGLFFCCKKQ
jgi:hypothetical protein